MDKIQFPVIPSNRSDDLHNLDIADAADLIVFMAGNQFMAMNELIEAFQIEVPAVKNIFYETLPPGLELKQILAGGAIYQGKVLNYYPDVYTSVSEKAMITLQKNGHIQNYHLYLHNRLSLMIHEGNPKNISSVKSLARDDVRVSQPDPNNEDIAFHIMDMYRAAGGEELVHRVMEEKRAEGTTIYTIVHHRETPMRIMKKTADIGPVWATEIIHAQNSGLSIEALEPGESIDQRDKINYYACNLKKASHADNGQSFLQFLKSKTAQDVFKSYGFVPY
jgi:ABC-type molybdate transport system substrate-binding protein